MTTPTPEQVSDTPRTDAVTITMGPQALRYVRAEHMAGLERELAVLRASSQAGERGNKAGPAFSGSLHAGFKAPSSGSLPNTSGTVTPATPPAPDTPLQVVNRQAEDEGLWFIAQTAPEAYLQRALRELHAAIERLATQDGEITALCYATHESVPGVAAAMRRAATLLRDLAAARQERDAAEARTEKALAESLYWKAQAIEATRTAEQARATALEEALAACGWKRCGRTKGGLLILERLSHV